MSSMRQRVASVNDLITAYARRMDDAPEVVPTDYLGDMLCDLRHWASREDTSFARAWLTSTSNFTSELRGEGEDAPRDLKESHPELFEMLVVGHHLDDADWQVVNMFLNRDDPEPDPDLIAPDPQQDDPPHGVVDNLYRAERVADLIDIYAWRTGLEDDEPCTQLSDMLCDIRHWSVSRCVTIAAPHCPSLAPDAPWQRGALMWVEDMLGEDVLSSNDELERLHPDLVRRVLLTLDVAPGGSVQGMDIRGEELRALNRSAYWDLNPSAPKVEPPEIRSINHELFS